MNNNLSNRRIITYQELTTITSANIQEQLIDVRTYAPTIIARYAKQDMLPYTGETIVVRTTVAQKLAEVNRSLAPKNMRLKIVYGYRHPDVQQAYFYRQRAVLQQTKPHLSDTELDAVTHMFVAVPTVAGHPTGGAVDLTLVDASGKEVDMGTDIADFTDPRIPTFSPGLSTRQRSNRRILCDAMAAQDFAPFYGEWWHFSYGDREWAVLYNQTEALYGPINVTQHF